MTEIYVTFLAVLTGFVPAFFLDGFIVHKVKDGTVRTEFSNGFVGKPVGVIFTLIEMLIGAFVAVVSDAYFQAVYTVSGSLLWIVAIAVVIWLIIIARMRIGGNYATRTKIVLFLAFIVSIFCFGYGTGYIQLQTNQPLT